MVLYPKNKKKVFLINFKRYLFLSTTVIEVGIDFPNANLIIIENANKFGLAQLHQLRGRVVEDQGKHFILLFKEGLVRTQLNV